MKKFSLIIMGMFGILLIGIVTAITVEQSFEGIVLPLPPNLTIYSPIDNSTYSDRGIVFNLTTLEEVDSISYIDWNDNKPKESILCKDCDEYGNLRKRLKTFNDGEHSLSFMANKDAETTEINISFFIDSKKPHITKTEPKKNDIVNGSEFYIKYSENNIKNIILFYANESKQLENCSSGLNQECRISVNLSDYDGQKIEYYFTIEDIAGNKDESRKTEVLVDTSPPKLKIYFPTNNTYNSKKIPFNITTTGGVIKIEYINSADSSSKFRTLCTNCDEYGFLRTKTKILKEGENNLTIKATDSFGNYDEKNISLFIDSKSPIISKTEPRRNSFTNGSDFYIKVKEDNLKNITITFNPTIALDLNKCTESRGYYECYIDLDLTSYNDQEINYYFGVEDIAGNKDESKPTLIKVDTNPPNLTNPDSFWIRGEGRYSNYVYFDMSIDEKNFDEAVLTYDYRGKTQEKRLCSRLRDGRCEYKFRLNDAYSNYELIIRDEAGNVDSREINF